ncbi:MAG: hypothetical protein EZS28_004460 [Streblomastix strix]|uniref:Uncharacterized protein n=1 Tax=Streblomastix strix TaxID=222440 RepID=A0A5J4WZV0_9EUKA|nr:MAG: hypothetical protein EZS28_004460 [Streblomastix strix]
MDQQHQTKVMEQNVLLIMEKKALPLMRMNGECFSGSGRWNDGDKVAVEVDMRNYDEVMIDGTAELKNGEQVEDDTIQTCF